MAKTRIQKNSQIEEYDKKLKRYNAFFVIKPLGVNPNESTKIKKALSQYDSTFNVVKNTLFKVALKDNNVEAGVLFDSQEHAVLFADAKFISEAAKILTTFAEESKKAEIVGGVLDNKLISIENVKSLAELPSKDVLISQFLSVINGPMTGLVRVMKANVTELLYALNAIKEVKSN